MRSRSTPWLRVVAWVGLSSAACVWTPAGIQAQEDPCAGRNPLYCGKPVTGEDGRTVVLAPPGGCEGRNPLYCREEKPKVEPQPERRRKKGRNLRSMNPNRNPARGGGSGGS